MSRSIEIAGRDGVIDAHIFTPASNVEARPPVILFTDIAGMRPSYMEKAQKIADGGYAVLMPNIYYRSARGRVLPDEGLSGDKMPLLFEYAKLLTPDALNRDFAAYLDAIEREFEFAAGPIAAIGYCLTGGFPVRLAGLFPEKIGAAAGFHSAALAVPNDVRSILDIIPAVAARVYFGHADKDDYLGPDQIARVDEALATASVHFSTELFRGALHGFTTQDSPTYDKTADTLHYKRIFNLLAETIASQVGEASS
jgi:carboxymethylenebutenolidase